MLTLTSAFPKPIPLPKWTSRSPDSFPPPKTTTARAIPPSSSAGGDSTPIHYDPSRDLLGLHVGTQPRNFTADNERKLRSWFGPNGQYIRELPCPSCRGRGYTPCAACGIERSRGDCSECNGKGFKTCQQCLGDRVIWEESIDERPWEKARSSSPFKVKEDDEVDNLDLKVDIVRRSKRVYPKTPPEVGRKISQSLKILNAKTGLFTNRMKILHSDPLLRAQRVAAIKKAKGTPAARQQASESMKAFFRNQENRSKRSISMKGVKFRCSLCGDEGHRRYYCPSLGHSKKRFKCGLCGQKGHNRRTCGRSIYEKVENGKLTRPYRCKLCGQTSHNRRTCPQLNVFNLGDPSARKISLVDSSECKRAYSCRFCLKKGHNVRTCPERKVVYESHNVYGD